MIDFNKSFYTENTKKYIEDVLNEGHPSGNGKYTKLCHSWLERNLPARKALLVNSGTAALEMQALLADVGDGDEIIMPSFTFVSTANAYVLRGAIPVFVDVCENTCNINPDLIEQAISPKTKAIVPVHYAGVGCEMDKIADIAKRYNLLVLEDAAQAFGAMYKGHALGTIGNLGAISFHETKNIMCGEGGALFINDEKYGERAEILWEKGTNRSKFFRGQVDKYTWVDIGSSYLPSDLLAAYLYSSLEMADKVRQKRLLLWNVYYKAFEQYEKKGVLRRPFVPDECQHNAHIFYLRFNELKTRTDFINHLKSKGITAVFHYIPLHSSPAGKKFGKAVGSMKHTDTISETMVRLPIFYDLDDKTQQFIIETSYEFLERL